MNKSQPNYDVVVVGGGMVGAAAALGLAQIGWSVALLEHDAPAPFDKDSVRICGFLLLVVLRWRY